MFEWSGVGGEVRMGRVRESRIGSVNVQRAWGWKSIVGRVSGRRARTQRNTV